MAQSKGLRDLSKDSYKLEPTIESINCGSLQRIADATEVMAKNYLQLQQDAERYKRLYLEYLNESNRLHKTIIGLKGVNGKLKKKLQSLTQNPQ